MEKIKMICSKCGLVHYLDIKKEEKKEKWVMVILPIIGILLVVLVWIWVFKWGVPLVKKIHNISF